MEMLEEMQGLIARHSNGERTETAIPGLRLLRSECVSPCEVQVVYTPMVCVIAQGRKRVRVGGAVLEYDAAKYLISSVDLPVSGSVTEATEERPYLALSLALDPKALAATLLELPKERREAAPTRGIAVGRPAPELLEAMVRLLRLLDRPEEILPLAPLTVREILYRLLRGDQAAPLRQIAMQQSRTAQVVRAIDWIRQNYAKPLHLDALAREANMSPASLYRHFKAVTAMSPLQYQKQIRLGEARQILVSAREDAAAAGFAVGYGSPSQFSREYHRLFGAPPRQDMERSRAGSEGMGLR